MNFLKRFFGRSLLAFASPGHALTPMAVIAHFVELLTNMTGE
jgi:hypothetical protein